MKLIETRSAWLYNCAAPAGTRTFLEVDGEKTESIVMSGCNLAGVETPVTEAAGVSPQSISTFGNSK